MRFHDLSTAPPFTGFGAFPAGGRTALPAGPDPHLRKMDRYGTIGFAAAQAALSDAGMSPPAEIDAQWGIAVGSSLGCWSSNARFYADLLKQSVQGVSPALFVRTVSNSVTGDVSIALRLSGASETFVSGWTAGADAIISAGTAIEQNRARRMLAGGVEAPDALPASLIAGTPPLSDRHWQPPAPTEAAAFALLDATATGDRLRLRAFWRGHDPARRWSLRGALDATAHLTITSVFIANSVPDDLLGRWREEAGRVPLVYLAGESGEPGAAGAVAALAAAAARGLAGALVVSRGIEGSVVALAAGR